MDKRPISSKSMLFVCIDDSCREGGAFGLYKKLKSTVKTRGLKGRIRVCSSQCMDACEDGPNVVALPEGVMCSKVQKKDIGAILEAAEGR